VVYEAHRGAARQPLTGYARREPEKTALYRIVQGHLPAMLAEAAPRPPTASACRASSSANSNTTSVAASSAADSQQHTTYSRDSATKWVTVTRRHHPLQGQSLEVVKRGRTQIVVRLGNGTSMRMPSTWTDVDGAPSQHTSDSIFTAEALRELLGLVDALRTRDRH
jgi:hypothetical protein